MTDFNLDPITAVIKAIASLATSPIKYQLERNEIVIQLRKKLNLAHDHPPSDFTAVYRYALVEYGADKLVEYEADKLQLLLEVFHQQEIIQAFRQAFEQNNQSILIRKGEDFLDWNILGDRVRELKVDIGKEFIDFQSVFIRVANSTRTPADVIQIQKIDNLKEILGAITNRLLAPQLWNSYVNLHGVEGLVSFEIEDIPNSFGVAEPDDTERQQIRLGQGFRLAYQLPFAGYALLMQGFSSSWVFTRLGKCTDSTLDKKTRYIQERIAVVPAVSWSVPTNTSYLREKVDIGVHRFVLLLSQKPFPEIIQEMIVKETTELSLSALNTLVEYIEDDPSSITLLVTECDIIR
ncbi:hypothetical protein HCG51_35020 (plasmid) [Tolypothrix sp. PCC 7910]|uniref:hypothetical protein n=1 Tax=Tolypothrix sp. PCC 7910 TaxID=2099387 RepID=UPI0014279AA7|nr:hypothetical protein [Tolypothrix sp. PCC 7910]QIR41890.1 hypothetical protein HCG51_35020 [Tolypothrix sp. PCC 7910]